MKPRTPPKKRSTVGRPDKKTLQRQKESDAVRAKRRKARDAARAQELGKKTAQAVAADIKRVADAAARKAFKDKQKKAQAFADKRKKSQGKRRAKPGKEKEFQDRARLRRASEKATRARAKLAFQGVYRGVVQGAPKFAEKRLYEVSKDNDTPKRKRFFEGQVARHVLRLISKQRGFNYAADKERLQEMGNDIQYEISQLRPTWVQGSIDGAILKVMNDLANQWDKEDVVIAAHGDVAPGARGLVRDKDGNVDLTVGTPRIEKGVPIPPLPPIAPPPQARPVLRKPPPKPVPRPWIKPAPQARVQVVNPAPLRNLIPPVQAKAKAPAPAAPIPAPVPVPKPVPKPKPKPVLRVLRPRLAPKRRAGPPGQAVPIVPPKAAKVAPAPINLAPPPAPPQAPPAAQVQPGPPAGGAPPAPPAPGPPAPPAPPAPGPPAPAAQQPLVQVGPPVPGGPQVQGQQAAPQAPAPPAPPAIVQLGLAPGQPIVPRNAQLPRQRGPDLGAAPEVNVGSAMRGTIGLMDIPLQNGSIRLVGQYATIRASRGGNAAKRDANTISRFIRRYFRRGGYLNGSKMTTQRLIRQIVSKLPGIFVISR